MTEKLFQKLVLEKLETLEANQANFITKDYLDKKLDGYATKEDLKPFATKDDLKQFATKDDLKQFATKDDLKPFATKKDLSGFVTKDYFEEQINMFARIVNDQFEVARKERSEIMNAIAHVWSDHEERISRLEEVR